MCLTSSFLATGGFKFELFQNAYDLQACLVKYITLAAFSIYALHGKDAAKGEVGDSARNNHGDYILGHGKSRKNQGMVFFNFCGDPETNHFLTLDHSIQNGVSLQAIKHLMSFEHATFSRAKANNKMAILGHNAFSCNVIRANQESL